MLDPDVRDLATVDNFAAFTTLNAAGEPRTHVMWVDATDDHVLVNTEIHRAKYADVTNDPRVTITIMDAENPYRYAEVRGKVVAEIRGAEARVHIDQLSQKYHGKDYANPIQSERVILKIAPDRIHKMGM